MNKIKTLSELNNLKETKDKFVGKISASWCGPCKALASTIEQLNIKDKFFEIDVDEADTDLVESLMVRNVPVLIFYDNGKEYSRLVGNQTKEAILQTWENNVPSN